MTQESQFLSQNAGRMDCILAGIGEARTLDTILLFQMNDHNVTNVFPTKFYELKLMDL